MSRKWSVSQRAQFLGDAYDCPQKWWEEVVKARGARKALAPQRKAVGQSRLEKPGTEEK
jgi:hypothetical protein